MPFDHQIEIDDKTKEFTLATRQDGGRQYQVTEIPLSVSGEGEISPDRALEFRQTDWVGGHGQGDFIIPDMYAEGQSIDTTNDGRVILGPLIYTVGISGDDLGANPVSFKWYAAISKLMVNTSAKVFWYDGTNFVAKTTLAGVLDLTEFAQILYLPRGDTGAYYSTTDGAAYTICDLDDTDAEKFIVSPNPAETADILWKFAKPNEVKSTTDGQAVGDGGVQWGSANYIGDTSKDITNLMLLNNILLIGREDNLFELRTDGGVAPLYNDLLNNQSSNNFKYATNYKSALYFSLLTGMGEIFASGGLEVVGPLQALQELEKLGSIVGLTSDRNFIYAAVDEGTNTIIYKGREITRYGVLRWEWCPFVFLGTNACATIEVVQHSASDRRLWFGYGDNAGYVILSDNPTADSAYRFCASGFVRESSRDANHRFWDKLLQYQETDTRGCTSTITIQPKYLKDTDTTASNLTPIIKTNGMKKKYLLNELNCKTIQFQYNLASNTNTITPELLYSRTRGILKPESIRIHDATYTLGDKPTERSKTLRAFLRSGRTSTSLIKFADLRYQESVNDKTYHWVTMLQSPQEIELLHEKSRTPQLGLRCLWQEMDFTI